MDKAAGGSLAADAFVGRETELNALNTALEHAAAGRGRVVMLVGEAGIGKTRTAAEFAIRARADGALILRGGCYEGEWAPPYGPFAEALTAYVRSADPVQLRDELGFGAAPLARLLPAIRERMPDVPEPVALPPDEERFRLFDAVSQFLIAIAQRRTAVVLIDDLHWADGGTIALLRHASRFASDRRLLFVSAYRNDVVEWTHLLAELLGVLRRESTYERVFLKGLDRQETGELITILARCDPGTAVLTDLHRHTEGNPFFVREMVHQLTEEGRLTGDRPNLPELSVPEGIRHVIVRRLARLSADARRFLTAAAAFDGPFRYDVAAATASLDHESSLTVVDDALRAQIINPTADAHVYDFSHALIRHTLYMALNPARRVGLHRKLAEALTQTDRDGTDVCGEIARQYHRSRTLPGAERGVEYSLRAIDAAEKQHAHYEAAKWLAMTLELLNVNDVRRPRLLSRRGLALIFALEFQEARSVCLLAADELSENEGHVAAVQYLAQAVAAMSNAGAMSSGLELARKGLELAGTTRDRPWAILKAADIVCREAHDPSYPGIPIDTPERREVAQVLRQTIGGDAWSRHLLDAVAGSFGSRFWSDEATSRKELLGQGVSFAVLAVGKYCEGLTVWYTAAATFEQEGRIGRAVEAWSCVSRFHTALGEFVPAIAAHNRASALARRLSVGSVARGYALTAADEIGMARDAALELAPTETDAPRGNPLPSFHRGVVDAGVARSHARLGRIEKALGRLEAVIPAIDRAPFWADNYVRICCDAAETLWLTRDTRHVNVVARNIRVKVVEPDFRYPMCDGRLALARLCALQQHYDQAKEWFSQARTVLDEQGARPLRAIVDYDEALMYARRDADGDRDRARPLLQAALTQFRAIGMPGWIRRAEHLLATGTEWSPTVPNVSRNSNTPSAPDTQHSTPGTCSFHCEGDVWAITFGGATHRLKDTRGLRYLAQLLGHPDREFHVNEIAAAQSAATGATARDPGQSTAVDLGDAGEILDGSATAQYQQRLADVREELSEADSHNDVGRSARLREQLEFLIAELARAGRGKRAASHAERARSAVGKRIRDALNQIAEVNPTLGRYLRSTVKTGTFCSYTPDPRLRVEYEP